MVYGISPTNQLIGFESHRVKTLIWTSADDVAKYIHLLTVWPWNKFPLWENIYHYNEHVDNLCFFWFKHISFRFTQKRIGCGLKCNITLSVSSPTEQGKKKQSQYMKNVHLWGTLADRVAALSVSVLDSPIHNLENLYKLMAMLDKKGKREALTALGKERTFIKSYIRGVYPHALQSYTSRSDYIRMGGLFHYNSSSNGGPVCFALSLAHTKDPSALPK